MTTGTVGLPAPARAGRAEFGLVVFAVALTAAAYVAVGIGHDQTVPVNVASYASALAAMFLAAHLARRRWAPNADPIFVPCAAALNGLGLVLIHRLDLSSKGASDGSLQLAWTAIGVGLFIVTLLVVRDHQLLERFTYTAMILGLVLLLLPAVVPARFSVVNGARIWIHVGGLSLQPGEVAKLALEVFFAGYLVRTRELLALAGRRVLGVDLPRGRDLGPVLLTWIASVVVLAGESDLGTSLLFFGVFIVMLYVATARTSWLVIGAGLFVAGSFVAYHLFAHVRERFDIWLHPFADPTNHGYQLVQGLFGMATGGILGTGLGAGRPGTVPFAKTDFIAATIGEELGLAGLMAILAVYLLLVSRGLRAAIGTRDAFGKLLGAGLAAGLALQVFVQVGGVTRLIPLTGLTLPFMSYGGSSLVSSWVVLALLVRISDAARRPGPAPVPRSPDDAVTQVVRR